MTRLREGLLEGRFVAVIGDTSGGLATALESLGATVRGDVGAGLLHALVYDARRAFAPGGLTGLRAALDDAWATIRDTATATLIPAARPAKIVLLAPAPTGGPFASASRAGLENLARTLSIEWARHGITTIAIAPGDRTSDQQLAELVCFLVSEAGGYFSGCRFELGSVA